MIHVRSVCRLRAHAGDAWRATQCFVSYADAAEHVALVEAAALPTRTPNASGRTWRVWIEEK